MFSSGRIAIITFGAVVLLGVAVFSHERYVVNKRVEEMKPYLTYTRLMYAATGCEDFEKHQGRWPSSASELRNFRPDLMEWSVDMWGRGFILVPYDKSLGYGELVSFARDGKPGGSTDLDRDIVVRYPPSRNEDWNEKVGRGLKKPELRAD